MKSAQREAMRQKARNKWDLMGMTEGDELEEAIEWHDSRMTTWTPSPEEVATTKAYLAAHPELPF